ncbi:MAG: hypothetical protein D6B27_13035 [Gammaproteobacteria bacterium]|nr:MAG: hypothetical protein D6B27_13035 [Gammaproteobacteria bacterium]
MRIFEKLDPNTIPDDPRVVFRFDYIATKLPYSYHHFDYLLIDGDYAIWASRRFSENSMWGNVPRPAYWLGGSYIEFPKQGLPWFLWAIKEKFFKTEAEGGLERGKFTYSDEFNGEKLVVHRSFGIPGYVLANHSRTEKNTFGRDEAQEYRFKDEMMFDNRLFEKLEIIAKKISSGEL